MDGQPLPSPRFPGARGFSTFSRWLLQRFPLGMADKGQTGRKLPRDTRPSESDFGNKAGGRGGGREKKLYYFYNGADSRRAEGYEAAEAPREQLGAKGGGSGSHRHRPGPRSPLRAPQPPQALRPPAPPQGPLTIAAPPQVPALRPRPRAQPQPLGAPLPRLGPAPPRAIAPPPPRSHWPPAPSRSC